MTPMRAHLGDGHSEHSNPHKDEESSGQADGGGHPLAHLPLYKILYIPYHRYLYADTRFTKL